MNALRPLVALALPLLLAAAPRTATAADDPPTPFEEQLQHRSAALPGDDEPALWELRRRVVAETPEAGVPWYRLEIGFGWASLLDDPDISQGFGGGLSFAVGFHRNVGIQLSFFFANNEFEEEIGTIQGSEFMAGNLNLGPVLRFRPWGERISLGLELGLGPYAIKDQLRQTVVWTLGIHGGGSLTVHLWRWLAAGIKLRYHLFNLATIAGDPLFDIKAFREVGVVDRFEMPVFLAAYF